MAALTPIEEIATIVLKILKKIEKTIASPNFILCHTTAKTKKSS
jgi:hypothetical protein